MVFKWSLGSQRTASYEGRNKNTSTNKQKKMLAYIHTYTFAISIFKLSSLVVYNVGCMEIMFESFSFIGFRIAYPCLINIKIKTLFPLCGIEVYFKLWFSKSSKLLLDQHASKQF